MPTNTDLSKDIDEIIDVIEEGDWNIYLSTWRCDALKKLVQYIKELRDKAKDTN